MKFNVRLNLRKQDSKKPEIIYLICRFGGEKFVYPTKYSVLPKNWNTKAAAIRNVIDEPNRDIINNNLKDLKTKAKGIFDCFPINERFTREYLKNELDKWTGKIQEHKYTFVEWIDKFIKDAQTKINPKTGRPINPRSIMNYNVSIKHLKDFSIVKRKKIDFNTLNLELLEDFREYLTFNKAFAFNNVSKQIDNIMAIIRAANTFGLPVNTEILNPKLFTSMEEAAQDVYLNEEDLQKIINLDLSDNSKAIYYDLTIKDKTTQKRLNFGTLQNVRDLFLIGCYSGLRISDYNNIKPYNIRGGNIYIFAQKTGKQIVVPINTNLQNIFDKYPGFELPKLSDQKFNLYLKQLCKLADISENIEQQQTKAGKRQKTISPKYELISSHTARRTFCTLSIKKGIPFINIMAITGHTSEKTFLKYLKASPTEIADWTRNLLNKN